ncbi:MAG: DNA-directed RNA polymerase subunit H [Methanosarcinales archaeon]|nr:MAG: DNA-directed RNA polymerase subunit H [Methanosarcinales archaeon]
MKKFNVRDHEIVPEHVIISKKDVEALLVKYSITKEQLPKIKSADPVCKEIDAKSDDVVKITRNSPTAGKSIAYRLVVD